MKTKPSKLDPFAERLDEWFSKGMTLEQAQEQLKLDGCSVSLSRLSEWWSARQSEKQQAMLLSQIASGARRCQEIDAELEKNPAPELQTIINLLKVLVMKLATQGNAEPEQLEFVTYLMKPIMEHFKESGKQEDRQLARQRFQRETCELFIKWSENEQAKAIAAGAASNSEKIQRLGALMFGEDWK